ncbi:MAG: 3'(2'),5'-bisphosphate nucleotidase CysQ [Crocinitomicaceae bacterium]|nr:3'(2'),5'-bisphosphate nucleotidase CysQ [Crocinitomicaceae bacterium]
MNNLDLAIEAAMHAGLEIMKVYNSEDFGIETKGDNSPLTKADKLSNEIILSYLSKTAIPILSEEGKHLSYEERKNWQKLWIVDPIDGTKEFIKRNGEFTVNIALIENQEPILGVIYVPAKKELYFADEHGAFKIQDVDNHNFSEKTNTKVALPLQNNGDQVVAVASKSHMSEETQTFIDGLSKTYGDVATLSKGSSLKLCMVAEGQADFYPRFAPTMEWDTAAGQAICKFAGCKVIDWETKKDMIYNREKLLNNWFLVIGKNHTNFAL